MRNEQSLQAVRAARLNDYHVSPHETYTFARIPHLVRRFRGTRPLIEVKIREGRMPDIVSDLRSGVADFGVGYVNSLTDGLDGVLLRNEPIHVLVPSSHPLAHDKRPHIALADLAHQPLVSSPIEGHLRKLIDGAAATAGIPLRTAVTVDRLLTIIHHVCAGVGIGLLPAGCLPMLQWGEGFHAALLTEPALSVDVGLITLHGRYQTPAATSMMGLIREIYGGESPNP